MSSAGETILVVDDEPSDLEMMRDALLDQGYQVLTAVDTPHAERVYREHGAPLDLLVTDVAMSPSSGCELARRLTRLQPDLRVLLVSGFTGEQIIEQQDALATGFAFLRKPFSTVELATKVRDMLGTRGHRTAGSI